MIQATSSQQFERVKDGPLPELEQIADDTWVIAIAMPTAALIRYTLCYLLRDSERKIHIFDPGWDTDENFARLTGALADIGHSVDDVVTITVSHLHGDHLDLAGRLREASGAKLQLHVLEQQAIDWMGEENRYDRAVLDEIARWGAPDDRLTELHEALRPPTPQVVIEADVYLGDGEFMQAPGRSIRAIHTPGHTIGHLCLHDEAHGLLFSGDHVLPQLHPGIGLGGQSPKNPLEEYFASLSKVLPYDGDEVLPGHGYRFRGLRERVEQHARHHLRRSAEVAAAIDADPHVGVWDLASGLTWSAGWERLRGFYLVSALQQTRMHRDLVLAGSLPALAEAWA